MQVILLDKALHILNLSHSEVKSHLAAEVFRTYSSCIPTICDTSQAFEDTILYFDILIEPVQVEVANYWKWLHCVTDYL